MSEILNIIDNLPDISIIDNLTLEDVQGMLINYFLEKYKEITGRTISLSKADPNRIIMLSCAQIIYQGLQHVEKAGKQNFLKYAYGPYLDNLAAFKTVTRNGAKQAVAPVEFSLAEPRKSATGIPAGTRVTAAYEVYFATTEYAEIAAGETSIEVITQCTEAGTIGNDYAAGEIKTLVDPIGFISSVRNTKISAGGAEIETDAKMAERSYLAPSSYSTAGTDDAYEYWVRDFNQSIGDIKITSPTPGVVDIRFTMDGGSIPDDVLIDDVKNYIYSQRNKRTLTDYIQVGRPETEDYIIELKYYINASDRSLALSIQRQVETAVSEYRLWQDAKIGRDINPDELITRIKNAGAKRAEVAAPLFRVVPDTAKAQCTGQPNIVYGGLEDD